MEFLDISARTAATRPQDQASSGPRANFGSVRLDAFRFRIVPRRPLDLCRGLLPVDLDLPVSGVEPIPADVVGAGYVTHGEGLIEAVTDLDTTSIFCLMYGVWSWRSTMVAETSP